jgi:hypothetical protein
LELVSEQYADLRVKLDGLIVRLTALEERLEKASVPYTKGKDQNWKEN